MATRLPSLDVTDGVRGSACLLVIAWHAVLTVIPSDPTPTQQLFTLPLGVGARTGLTIFIVMSGLLLGRHWVGGWSSQGWLSKSWVYTRRRLWRLLPTYWVALAFVIACMLWLGLSEPGGTHWDTGLPLTPERVLTNVLLITDVTFEVPLSHQFWTVAVELHLYVLGPLIVLVASRFGAVAIGFATTALIVLFAPEFHAPYFPFIFVVSFWVGMKRQTTTTASARETLAIVWPVLVASAALLVLAVAAGTLPPSTGNYFVTDAIFAPLMLWWLAHCDFSGRRDRVARLLLRRPFVWIGHRSYSLYLMHAVALELTWRFVMVPIGADGRTAFVIVLLCVLGTGLSFVLALALYQWVELPTARRSAAVGRASRTSLGGGPAGLQGAGG